jgi:hypothetical protein
MAQDYTQCFIDKFEHRPFAAAQNIDYWAMTYQLIDTKRAAESCGLVFIDGKYQVTERTRLDMIQRQLNAC